MTILSCQQCFYELVEVAVNDDINKFCLLCNACYEMMVRQFKELKDEKELK